jgi:hypothetical protein
MGGYYRSNGTVVRNVAPNHDGDEADEPIYVENDVAFASLNDRTHARIRHQETLRQANIEAILSVASGLLGQKVTDKAVDSDWANIFFDYAQNISSSPMQSLWARTLLCELKHPNSISKRSLNFLYHCDAWEIAAFKKVSNYAFIGNNGHPFIFRANPCLKKEDDIFSELRLLSHCVNAGMIARDPSELTVGYEFYYRKKLHSVSHEFTGPGQGLGFYIQPFTKTGSDLLKIVGGLDSIPSSNLQRRVVWEYLSDFIDIENASTSAKTGNTYTATHSKRTNESVAC